MTKDNQKFLDNLSKLGFPMVEAAQKLDVNETLADVVKSHDTRLWEGFPIVLINAADHHEFSLEKVQQHLSTPAQGDHFRLLMILSGSLYWHFHLSFSWWTKFKSGLTNKDRNQIRKWKIDLDQNQKLMSNDLEFDPFRLKRLFEIYYETQAEKGSRRKQQYEEFSLEFALSQVFSPKQKELFNKKLDGLPLNKTEKEYYSRRVKKKVIALANLQLHDLARRLLEQ
jgi:hypothetical protein